MIRHLINTISFILILLLISSCKKLEIYREVQIQTDSISDISKNSVIVYSSISDLGNGVESYGYCWDSLANPQIADKTINLGIPVEIGVFQSEISDLLPNTRYYIRSYVINKELPVYGNELSFSTLGRFPDITLSEITTFTQNSANYKANISEGSGEVTGRGICWSISPQPKIKDNYRYNGNATGEFDGVIPDLKETTKYYIRAFGINYSGTFYSNEIELLTLPNLPEISTNQITEITSNSAFSGGTIIDSGGEKLLSRGIYIRNYSNPSDSSIIIDNGISFDAFTIHIKYLNEKTRYNIKAFATNRAGTSFGEELSFITSSSDTSKLFDIDGNDYEIVTIGNQIWMAENLKTTKYNNGTDIPLITDNTEWSNLTTSGYCWYNNDMTTYSQSYGALYNWHTVNTGNLCPTGWHVPTETEWTTLINYLGGESVAGGKLKEAGNANWANPNTSASDEFGFTAFPGGTRIYGFYFIGEHAYFWSSSTGLVGYAWNVYLSYDSNSFCSEDIARKECGRSVRCIKD